MVNKKITYSLSTLKSLIEKKDSCVTCLENCKRSFSYSSATYKDVKTLFAEYLNSQVTTYDQKLGGIILSQKNVRISPLVQISDDEIVRRTYWADIYVFKPTVGSNLSGNVIKKTAVHLGVLVHSVFNVTIPRPEDSTMWPGASFKYGDAVTFEVEKIIFKANLPYIRGKLLDIFDTSSENSGKKRKRSLSICEEQNDNQQEPKKKRKKKNSLELSNVKLEDSINCKADTTDLIMQTTIDDLINLECSLLDKKKKKKSSTIFNDTSSGSTPSIDDSVEIRNKQKKKSKKSTVSDKTEVTSNSIVESDPINYITEDSESYESFKKNKSSDFLNGLTPYTNDSDEITNKKKKSKKSLDGTKVRSPVKIKSEPIDSGTEDISEYVKKKKKGKKSSMSLDEFKTITNSMSKPESVLSPTRNSESYETIKETKSSAFLYDIPNGLTSYTNDSAEIINKEGKKSKKSSLLLDETEERNTVKVKSEPVDSATEDTSEYVKKKKKKSKRSSLLLDETEERNTVRVKSEPVDSTTEGTSEHVIKKKTKKSVPESEKTSISNLSKNQQIDLLLRESLNNLWQNPSILNSGKEHTKKTKHKVSSNE